MALRDSIRKHRLYRNVEQRLPQVLAREAALPDRLTGNCVQGRANFGRRPWRFAAISTTAPGVMVQISR